MVVIKSFLPNPVGRDADGERIILYNDGAAPVDLNGWKIRDAGGKEYVFKNGALGAGEERAVDYRTTRITLNNDGETITLYDAAGNHIDVLSYVGAAREGQVILRTKGMAQSGSEASVLETLPAVGDIIPLQKFGGDVLLALAATAVMLAAVSFYVIKKFGATPRTKSPDATP